MRFLVITFAILVALFVGSGCSEPGGKVTVEVPLQLPCPKCNCGCEETGSCKCKDCNHHTADKIKTCQCGECPCATEPEKNCGCGGNPKAKWEVLPAPKPLPDNDPDYKN